MRGGTKKIAVPEGMWFAETIAPDPLLLIVGASPIAVSLCELASRTGFRVSIVDPRRDFARVELFPAAERVVHAWPAEGLADAGMDAHSFVAVVAHDEKLDVPALEAALRAECRYIGLLGSKGTQAQRRALLAEAGFAPEAIARIRGPIGLKHIGALEPAEIAVSILAELILARRGADAAERAAESACGCPESIYLPELRTDAAAGRCERGAGYGVVPGLRIYAGLFWTSMTVPQMTDEEMARPPKRVSLKREFGDALDDRVPSFAGARCCF